MLQGLTQRQIARRVAIAGQAQGRRAAELTQVGAQGAGVQPVLRQMPATGSQGPAGTGQGAAQDAVQVLWQQVQADGAPGWRRGRCNKVAQALTGCDPVLPTQAIQRLDQGELADPPVRCHLTRRGQLAAGAKLALIDSLAQGIHNLLDLGQAGLEHNGR